MREFLCISILLCLGVIGLKAQECPVAVLYGPALQVDSTSLHTVTKPAVSPKFLYPHGVGIVSLPKFLPFKPEFNLGAILSVLAIFLVSATETIGDTSALASSALGRDVKPKEISGSIACDGFVSSIAGVMGCTPITSFSQNVGLAAMTKVVNRFAIATGAVILILAGIFPAISVILTTIPQAVLGGCTIMMFGSIVFAGIGMVAKCGTSQRNLIIVSLSLSVGLGFTQATGMFAIFPQIVQTVFAENCVAVVFLLAVILNLVLPKKD